MNRIEWDLGVEIRSAMERVAENEHRLSPLSKREALKNVK